MTLSRPLITGAGGFIGAHLAKRLSQMEEVERVYIVDLPDNERIRKYATSEKFQVIECDLSNPDSKNKLPEDATVIFALAALNGTGRFYTQPNTVLINSTLPTLSVLSKYAGGIPIIYSSSSEVYATTTELFGWETPTNEEVPPSISDVHNPRWSYATAKLFGEVALTSSVTEHGGSGAIVRYHNVYGPDMGMDHFVPDFIGRALKGTFRITGGEQTRAFMYIDDAVNGTIAAAVKANSSVPIYHLGSTDEITILEASKIILNRMGLKDIDIQLYEAPEGSVSRRCANSDKAKKELGRSAEIDFDSGIRKFLEAFI